MIKKKSISGVEAIKKIKEIKGKLQLLASKYRDTSYTMIERKKAYDKKIKLQEEMSLLTPIALEYQWKLMKKEDAKKNRK